MNASYVRAMFVWLVGDMYNFMNEVNAKLANFDMR